MRATNSKLARHGQRGFTLVEILIALTIGLFLMGALLTIVQTNRRVFGEQSQLAQMQDNERMAMTMMGDVIQSGGYFPDPVHNSLTTALTATGPFAVGQSIFGIHLAAAPHDQVQVRYMTAGGDGILNCSGGSNPGAPAATQLYVNWFQVQNGRLVCTVTVNGGAPTSYTLVGGAAGSGLDITDMRIRYGVRADATKPGNNVDTYMDATQINGAPGLWGSVISVQITLTFTNPLNPLGTVAGQPATFQIQRVIGVMSQTGPTI
jgi:type IV pilus assembly protein PilW